MRAYYGNRWLMKKLTGTQRKYLRGLAHKLRPSILIGYEGLSDSVMKTLDKALDDKELIKVKFNKFKEEKETFCMNIESSTKGELVGLIGNVAIFYRQQSDPEKRKIKFS
jgi:RNA-binding protein